VHLKRVKIKKPEQLNSKKQEKASYIMRKNPLILHWGVKQGRREKIHSWLSLSLVWLSFFFFKHLNFELYACPRWIKIGQKESLEK